MPRTTILRTFTLAAALLALTWSQATRAGDTGRPPPIDTHLIPLFEACKPEPDPQQSKKVHMFMTVHMPPTPDSHYAWVVYGDGVLTFHPKTETLEGTVYTRQTPRFTNDSNLKFHVKIDKS